MRKQNRQAIVKPAARLGSVLAQETKKVPGEKARVTRVKLDFAMIWSSASPPVVHVDHGMSWGIVDVRSCRLVRSCLSPRWVGWAAERWVSERREKLLRRWDEIGGVTRRRNSPQISRFSGMKVEMYWSDHADPHIHVRFSGETIVVNIRAAEVTEGRIASSPKRTLLRWVRANQAALLVNWNLAARNQPFAPIDPP